MRTGVTISAVVHVAVLVFATVTMTTSPPRIVSPTPMSVELVTTGETSQMTPGAQNAPPSENAKPLVEKLGPARPVEDPHAKVVPNKEITASTDASPPLPTPRPPTPVEKKSAEPKRDLIADAIKKDDTKKKTEQKKVADAKTPVPPKRPPQQQPKHDPRLVKELLDRRVPQRQAATGDAINDAISLGAPQAVAAQLSQNELEALRAHLAKLWNPPAGAQNPQELVVTIRIRLKPDGMLDGVPGLLSRTNSPAGEASASSALRAVFRGQPFSMLRPETYEQWKDIEITFDPRDMIRG